MSSPCLNAAGPMPLDDPPPESPQAGGSISQWAFLNRDGSCGSARAHADERSVEVGLGHQLISTRLDALGLSRA